MAFAMYRLAVASGWSFDDGKQDAEACARLTQGVEAEAVESETPSLVTAAPSGTSASLLGWEDLGDAWALDSDAFSWASSSRSRRFWPTWSSIRRRSSPVQSRTAGPAPATGSTRRGGARHRRATLLNCAGKWAPAVQEGAEFVGDAQHTDKHQNHSPAITPGCARRAAPPLARSRTYLKPRTRRPDSLQTKPSPLISHSWSV